MYTLQNIQTAPSYKALVRNGFTDIDVVAYYGISAVKRVAMFLQIKNGGAEKLVQVPTKIQGTQKCTVDFDSVRDMALEHMEKDFDIDGRTFNMKKMGWAFGFNTNKTRFGVCIKRRNRFDGTISNKKIELSQWLISESDKTFEKWVDTMLHEIAHAIDVEIRGHSAHDYTWRRIALDIGCDGKRCSDAKVSPSKAKYTLICPNGHTKAGHKFSRVIDQGRRACVKCCNEHSFGQFDRKFLLTQTQNY